MRSIAIRMVRLKESAVLQKVQSTLIATRTFDARDGALTSTQDVPRRVSTALIFCELKLVLIDVFVQPLPPPSNLSIVSREFFAVVSK